MKRQADGQTEAWQSSHAVLYTQCHHTEYLLTVWTLPGLGGGRWCYISEEGWTFIREGEESGTKKSWTSDSRRTLHLFDQIGNGFRHPEWLKKGCYIIVLGCQIVLCGVQQGYCRLMPIITGPHISASKFKHILFSYYWPWTVFEQQHRNLRSSGVIRGVVW